MFNETAHINYFSTIKTRGNIDKVGKEVMGKRSGRIKKKGKNGRREKTKNPGGENEENLRGIRAQ